MNFAAIAGDDEHTAVEGPYTRLMKTRKWLVLSSGLAVLSASKLYDADAVKSLIRIAEVPTWLFASTILAGLTYLTIQYGFLLYQLRVTYDLTLSERLAFRRADDLAKANEAVRLAAQALEEASAASPQRVKTQPTHQLRQLQKQLRELNINHKEAIALTGSVSVGDPRWQPYFDREVDARKQADSLKEKLRLARMEANFSKESREKIVAAETNYELALRDLRNLSRQDPSRRGHYRAAEIAIDILRIVPPALVSAIAIMWLTIYHFELYDLIDFFGGFHASAPKDPLG